MGIFTKNTLHGILWMILRCFIFSLLALCYKKAGENIPAHQVFFLVTFVRLLMVIPAIFYTKGAILKTSNPRFFVLRAGITTVGHVLWVYAVTIVPINQATAISFTAPLFTTLIATLLLKESISIKRIIAILAGFAGVMIIIRPDINGITYSALLVLIMAVIWAITDTIIKLQTNSETVGGQLFHNSLLMTCFVAPFAIMTYIAPTFEGWIWIVVAGLLSLLNNMTIFISYGKADLSIVAPFTFTRLVFTAIFAYILLNEIVSIEQIVGSAIIVASSAYITRLETTNERKFKIA